MEPAAPVPVHLAHRDPPGDVRDFRDPDGREWKVWGVMPTRRADVFLPETMAAGWLCFESAEEKRRLHPIAEGWEALPESGLWELCARAEPVTPRAAPPPPGPSA